MSQQVGIDFVYLNSAVSKLGLVDLEWKAEGLHQFSALITNSAVNLDAEAIS